VRLNLGSKGITSVRVGGRGGGVSIGKTGVRSTVSAPGTGLSYSTHTPWKEKRRRPVAPSLDGGPAIEAIRHGQAMTKERLDKIEAFERQIAEGANIDYETACHELLEFAKALSAGYMEMCDRTISFIGTIQSQQEIMQSQQSARAPESSRLLVTICLLAILFVTVATYLAN
jgi:Protein of unknown function (DUF4236)